MKTIRVKVKPNARCNQLEKTDDKIWLAQIKAPPVDGKANEALIELMADYFNLTKSQVSIKSDTGSRVKTVLIDA